MIRLGAILFFLMSATLASAQANLDSLTDAEVVELIAQVKQTSVSQLDSSLPRMSLARWLRVEVGPHARIGWALRYAQATGTEDEDDFPTCVEINVVREDGWSVTIFIGIGTHGKVRDIKPFVFSADLWKPDQSNGDESIGVDRLSDLPAALRKTFETANP